MTELGSALKFETDEPHFVSLGGGRLSIGVTLCPIKRGSLSELSKVYSEVVTFISIIIRRDTNP